MGNRTRVTVSVYVLVGAGLALALAVAMLIPAPTRPAEDGAGVGSGLLVAGCVTALVMGLLALLGLPVATAALGAVAWLLVMPCIWLARAPEPLEDGWHYETDEDDDGGGSPRPSSPFVPPAADEQQAGAQAPITALAPGPWTPARRPAPVLATAEKVQQMLAAQEAQRLLAAQEVERMLAAAAQIPLPEVPAAPGPEPAGPLHTPEWPRLQPAPRVRADHRSIAHAFAAVAHAHTRRRAAAAQRRAERTGLRG